MSTARRLLDALYDAAAYVAALFLISTLVMVLLGIFGRLLAFQIRGTDAYAGYFMAGAGFLALAHTLMRGEHIRVTLVLEHAGGNGAALAGTMVARGGVAAQHRIRVLQLAPSVAVACIPRHLHRQRCDPAVDSAAVDGDRQRDTRDRLHRSVCRRAAWHTRMARPTSEPAHVE